MKNDQINVVGTENLSWIGKIVKISVMLLKNYILVGVEKILVGRDNFETGWRGGGRFREILSCP